VKPDKLVKVHVGGDPRCVGGVGFANGVMRIDIDGIPGVRSVA
jgi:hypothetical protein